MQKITHYFILALLLVTACSSNPTPDDNTGSLGTQSINTNSPGDDRYQPLLTTTWQWQLSGSLNLNYNVDLYDIDLFDVDPAQISALRNDGRHVICYFSAGSYEQWRVDAMQFPEPALGNSLDGWDGERWLDIRNQDVRTIMLQRLELAVQKGCDGVEPDNIDGYSNQSGFALTSQDQLDFNRFLAQQSHDRNLAIGLKNDLDQIPQLIADFDFAVNEQCFEFDECELLQPFVDAGKPVFNVEYDAILSADVMARESLCLAAQQRQFRTLILPLELDDAFRLSCP